ncbi:hypothetical protein OUZ56_008564 [Daphnia magna]|uniref:Uncharacterized protein n=1 Tax=Daphnia magna TaxID=35525 RepID=A0ABR0ADC8_9CRUS|nr:hypothetical protein OUZ56_008564 [Daphnia magna]
MASVICWLLAVLTAQGPGIGQAFETIAILNVKGMSHLCEHLFRPSILHNETIGFSDDASMLPKVPIPIIPLAGYQSSNLFVMFQGTTIIKMKQKCDEQSNTASSSKAD